METREEHEPSRGRARWVGALAALAHVGLTAAFIAVAAAGLPEGMATVMAIVCAAPLLLTVPFVYTGASRAADPSMEVTYTEYDHGRASVGGDLVDVSVARGTKSGRLSRKNAIFMAALGFGGWLAWSAFVAHRVHDMAAEEAAANAPSTASSTASP